MESLTVQPLGEKHLEAVAQIHRETLGYTFNSRLGLGHLTFMYNVLARDGDAYVGVALLGDRPVGVVSGTVDTDRIMGALLKTLRPRQAMNIFFKFLLHPGLILEWRKGNAIGGDLNYEGTIVRPTLTTIAVAAEFHGKGIGRELVNKLEGFFKQKGVRHYRLDTLTSNTAAIEFYSRLGFQAIETRADSILYVKKINHG